MLICSVLCVYVYQFDVHEITGGFQDEAESMDVGELISRCNVEEARYLIEHCLQLTIERVSVCVCVCVCVVYMCMLCGVCVLYTCACCVCVCMCVCVCVCVVLACYVCCCLECVWAHVCCVCMWFCCCFVPVFFVLFLSLSACIVVVLFLSLSACIVPVPGFYFPFLDLFFVPVILSTFLSIFSLFVSLGQ